MTAKQRWKRWYAKNKAKVKERSRRWYLDNKDRVRKRDASPRAKKMRGRNGVEYRYGKGAHHHFVEQYIKQDKWCAICRKPLQLFSKDTHRDHNHKTKKLRGLLCSNCNHGLGKFADSISNLESAIRYLKRWL